MDVRTHKDLDAWKCALDLAKQVYEVTDTYAKGEVFGLVSQMRRAAVSIASNIVQGAARSSNKEFLRFLYIALGSSRELATTIKIGSHGLRGHGTSSRTSEIDRPSIEAPTGLDSQRSIEVQAPPGSGMDTNFLVTHNGSRITNH